MSSRYTKNLRVFVQLYIENFIIIVTEIYFSVQVHCNSKTLSLNYYDIFYFVYPIVIKLNCIGIKRTIKTKAYYYYYYYSIFVYISRPTRCTNSYNVSLFIIKCSTCFGLFSPSSGATCWSCTSELVYAGTISLAYTNYNIQLQKKSLLMME